jgi:hypothetical protein
MVSGEVSTARSIADEKILDNASNAMIFPGNQDVMGLY